MTQFQITLERRNRLARLRNFIVTPLQERLRPVATAASQTAVDPPSRPDQANNFNALRFIMALCVIFAHSFDLMGGKDPVSSQMSYTGLGREAVIGFFLLSGYLITMSWTRSRSVGDYFKRRVLRIYPGFIVVCLLCGLMVGPLCSDSPAWYWSHFNPKAFLTHIVELRLLASPAATQPFRFGNVNGSLWTIHEEFLCYLLVALLGCARMFKQRSIILGLFVCVYGAVLLFQHFGVDSHFHGTGEFARLLPLLAAFLLGSCFFLHRDKIVFNAKGALLCLIVTITLLHCAGKYGFLCLPFEAYLLFAFAFSSRIRLHNFARRGDYSYGVYLYAFPIQCLLIRYCASSINCWTLFMLATPLTLFCAVLSWRFVEKPFARKKTEASSRKEITRTALLVPTPAIAGTTY